MKVIVRTAPEINIKSDKIKARFLKRLRKNLARALDTTGVEYSIENRWSKLLVDISGEEGLAAMTRVFGVDSISPVEHECENTLEAMKETIVKHYSEKVAGKTFAVRVKRNGAKGFSSLQAEQEVGGCLRPFAKSVDLKNPEFQVNIEVNQHGASFFSHRIMGPGGLPLGTQGKALCMISGGFDSAVAAWEMMKRGVALDYIFCNLAGSAYERSVLAVVKGLASQWAYGTSPKVHIVDFQPVVAAIDEHVRPQYAQMILKRMFYRVSNKVADYENKSNYLALVTGEAIGQVSSQTLKNLAAIDCVSDRLVLRPLITTDKQVIINQARKIGTHLLCEHIQEYCSLSKSKPVTGASISSVDHFENDLPDNIVEETSKATKTVKILDLNHQELVTQYLYTEEIEENAILIDCRTKDEYKTWHYPGALYLDLSHLIAAYKSLDKSKTYVLYCAYGFANSSRC